MSDTGRRSRRGIVPVAAGVLLLAATGVGVAVKASDQPLPDAGALPAATATASTTRAPGAADRTSTGSPTGSPSTAADPSGGPTGPTIAADRSFEPTMVRVPAIGVSAPVVPTAVDGSGALGIPEDPREVGWWSGGAAPGSPYGTTLLAGHVDSASRGLGSLVDLSRAPIGARVTVTGADGASQAYRVVARRSYPKATLPTTELFRQDVPARLLLITCGGQFDRSTGHYERNVVVFAVPV
ncbi:class F sortase [Pedococcus sp. NPDC057267]|uniref:class F sortase n=1 Tax=Pedococcus sp. NPDC057267 TaxID=3346077 RepID=UPI003639525A